jgi:hypothetical protein
MGHPGQITHLNQIARSNQIVRSNQTKHLSQIVHQGPSSLGMVLESLNGHLDRNIHQNQKDPADPTIHPEAIARKDPADPTIHPEAIARKDPADSTIHPEAIGQNTLLNLGDHPEQITTQAQNALSNLNASQGTMTVQTFNGHRNQNIPIPIVLPVTNMAMAKDPAHILRLKISSRTGLGVSSGIPLRISFKASSKANSSRNLKTVNIIRQTHPWIYWQTPMPLCKQKKQN